MINGKHWHLTKDIPDDTSRGNMKLNKNDRWYAHMVECAACRNKWLKYLKKESQLNQI